MSLNVFADMGFEEPELEMAKCQTAHVLYDVICRNALSQADATKQLRLGDGELDRLLLHGGWGDYSLEQLIAFVHVLDPDMRFDLGTGEGVTQSAPLALVS